MNRRQEIIAELGVLASIALIVWAASEYLR